MAEEVKVVWFRQDHEHRNYWLRFGFMQMHRAGRVRYVELPWGERTEYGFDASATEKSRKAASLLVVEKGGERCRCVVDSNDSFFVMSDLVEHADLYFCAGFNSSFFRRQVVPEPLAWQRQSDIAKYQQRGAALLERHGKSFGKVLPFIPIAPNLQRHSPLAPSAKKIRNARHKIQRFFTSDVSWSSAFDDFDDRYQHLLSLRDASCTVDVALLDTLWGWPQHRLQLHRKLRELSLQGYAIQSRLGWHEPSEWDGSSSRPLSPQAFPFVTGEPIDDYEKTIAQSRMATFATGFHFGWRNIMTLCLMIGVPILSDRIILEPWFGLDRFQIAWNDDAEWSSIEKNLRATTDGARKAVRVHNTRTFDEVMTPESTATYVIDSTMGEIG